MQAHSDFATCCSISQGYYFTGRVNMMPMTLFTQWLETIFFFYNVSKSQGFNFAGKKNNHVNHLILKRKKVKFHIYESSLSAWKFTDQWNLTLQVQGADYTLDLISSLLHGSLLHRDLLLDFPSSSPVVAEPSLCWSAESRDGNCLWGSQ